MLSTLHWYIFREMGKTFLLAAFGLTAVLGLGGGVMNLIDLEQVTPAQLVRLMLIVLPVAGSLTLPVAALYSATATYGRLSADNEFVACRSSGINIHRLFLGPVVLSVLVAACTFYFSSFLVPGLIRDLNRLSRMNPRELVAQQLDSPKRLEFPTMPVKIYADRTASPPDQPAIITLSGVAFLEVAKKKPEQNAKAETGSEYTYVSYGTAEGIILRFSMGDDGKTNIGGRFVNATLFDVGGGAWSQLADQEFGPVPLPHQIRPKVKWLNLRELVRYQQHPEEWSEVSERLESFRANLVRERFIAARWHAFETNAEVTLHDADGTITLSANDATLIDDGRKLALTDVIARSVRNSRSRTIQGSQATLSTKRTPAAHSVEGTLLIKGSVVVTDERGRETRRGQIKLGGINVDDGTIKQVAAMTDLELLNEKNVIDAGPTGTAARLDAIHEAGKFVRGVTSELNSRLAFSASIFVLVVLAAALGVVFRGSHMLAAFGISFVPALGVIVMNIMGRQLAEKDGTVGLGLATIWGSIIVVALVDVWMLVKVVRR